MPPRAEVFSPRSLERQLARLLPSGAGKALCVAFSGGGDSTALLAALALHRHPARVLRAVHIDHGLHSDSAQWSARALEVARGLGVHCEVLRERVQRTRGESLEARARAVRYRLLTQALAPGEVLLTAHNEDDQLETVLLQLLRGAGLAGLAAMPQLAPFARGWLARPLLSRSRAELRAFLESRDIPWAEDPSNADERLDRNYLRLRVLPLVRARWPAAAATVSRAARHAAEAQGLLESQARGDVGRASHGRSLSAAALRALPPDRRRNALRFWIATHGPVPGTRRLGEIAGALLAARGDAQPLVEWPGMRVQREGELLTIRPTAAVGAADSVPGPRAELRWRWRTTPVCLLPAGLGTIELVADARGPLDLGALGATLEVRWRRGGERLAPVRGGARRALKSLLQESRMPVAQRRRLPLVYSRDTLVAVADRWLDQSVQARPATRRRARLKWTDPGA